MALASPFAAPRSAAFDTDTELRKAGGAIAESNAALANLSELEKLRVMMDVAGGLGRKWREFSQNALEHDEATESEVRYVYAVALYNLAASSEIAGFPKAGSCYALEADFMFEVSRGKRSEEDQPICRSGVHPPDSKARVLSFMAKNKGTERERRLNTLAGTLINNIMLEAFYTMKLTR